MANDNDTKANFFAQKVVSEASFGEYKPIRFEAYEDVKLFINQIVEGTTKTGTTCYMLLCKIADGRHQGQRKKIWIFPKSKAGKLTRAYKIFCRAFLDVFDNVPENKEDFVAKIPEILNSLVKVKFFPADERGFQNIFEISLLKKCNPEKVIRTKTEDDFPF